MSEFETKAVSRKIPDRPANPLERRSGFLLGMLASLATWGLYFVLLWPRMLVQRSDGLYAGWRTVWADWAAHFAYANVFAYRPVGAWLSSHPLFAARSFDYPFLADALSGLLMRAGMDRVAAFLLPSVAASLALVALLYVLYASSLGSPRQALLAVSLFFTNGGLGFLAWMRELARDPSLRAVVMPPREYTYLPEHDIHWINIVSSEILPQRALLMGIPLALAVLIPVWWYSRSGFEGASSPKLCALGFLSGLLVVAHVHSFLALVILCAVLLCFAPRHYGPWLVFAGSAAVPSLLLLSLVYGDAAGRGFVSWHPGWMAHPAEGGDISPLLFLWLNWGVFLPIAAVSIVRFRYDRDPLVVGGMVLFVLCLLFRFQPTAWDNMKLLTWAHLILCIPVTRYLAYLWERGRVLSRGVAALLLVFCTASGALELWRLTRTDELAVRMWSAAEIELADDFRELSDPTAIVLCSDDHHHWVPSLSGRQILLGYRGWIGSYGLDYGPVERDVRKMLGGASDAELLIEQHGVDYVVIGPTERRDYAADESYFLARHELVLEGADHRVFRVTPASEVQPP